MFEKILVPVDGSEHASRALDVACDLARHYGASITVVHVMEAIGSSRVPEGLEVLESIEHVHITESEVLRGVAHNIVERAEQRCRSAGVGTVSAELLDGNPREVITRRAAAGGFDLIVMGRRGLGRMADLLLGSVSHRVTQTAECACLTVK